MRVYKVLKRSRDKLYSFIVYDKAGVEYKPGIWIKAPEWLAKEGYHITAFKNLQLAENFCEAIDILWPGAQYELWEAEAENIIEQLPPIMHISKIANGLFIPWHRNGWPFGTVMAERIKLVRLLKTSQKGGEKK